MKCILTCVYIAVDLMLAVAAGQWTPSMCNTRIGHELSGVVFACCGSIEVCK